MQSRLTYEFSFDGFGKYFNGVVWTFELRRPLENWYSLITVIKDQISHGPIITMTESMKHGNVCSACVKSFIPTGFTA